MRALARYYILLEWQSQRLQYTDEYKKGASAWSQSMCIYCNDEMYVENPSAIENFFDTTSKMILCVKFVDTFIIKKSPESWIAIAWQKITEILLGSNDILGCNEPKNQPMSCNVTILSQNHNMNCQYEMLTHIYSPYIIYNSYLHSCRKCHVKICCSSSCSTATITSIQFHPTSNGRTRSG